MTESKRHDGNATASRHHYGVAMSRPLRDITTASRCHDGVVASSRHRGVMMALRYHDSSQRHDGIRYHDSAVVS
uniref:Uncharacterized protein n=1 Tax=Acrobeloides nanus TaxID=290746 RepID=A0A914E800_9BILA